jgi:hypothetical protein
VALSVTRSRVKEKCGISASTYDTAIDNIIADYVPAIEFAIRTEYVAAVSNVGLQATLNLGALEICCGEFMAQRFRETGTALAVAPDGFPMLQFFHGSARDPSGLVGAGWQRLKPYLGVGASVGVSVGVISGLKEASSE